MNQISTFEFADPRLHQFRNTHIYYIKHKSTHQLLLLDSVVCFHTIYLFKYDTDRDRIIIYYTTSEYSGICLTEIYKAGTLDNVFELFEWLIPKLMPVLTNPD
jgi:hypothetical protein